MEPIKTAADVKERQRIFGSPMKTAIAFSRTLATVAAKVGAAYTYESIKNVMAQHKDVLEVVGKCDSTQAKQILGHSETCISAINVAIEETRDSNELQTATKTDMQQQLEAGRNRWNDIADTIREKIADGHQAKTLAEITKAISRLAKEYRSMAQDGFPFLAVGPTGCGKTAGFEVMAAEDKMQYYELVGTAGKTAGDAWGLEMPSGTKIPGPATRAFQFARQQYASGGKQKALLLFDELTRFNTAALGSLLEPTRKRRAEHSATYGLSYTCDFYLGESPLWGVEHAPCDNIVVAGACNPWGAQVDDALNRRFVNKVFVTFDRKVIEHFDPRLKGIIEANWTQVEQSGTNLMMPMEYDLIGRAKAPDDFRICNMFANNLRFKEMGSKVMLTRFVAECAKVGVRVAV